jgi:hypothetical protein
MREFNSAKGRTMALQGTLKDFSITEIIQLIGQQLKTGVLKVRRGKNLVEVYFVDGMIVHVYSNYRGQKDLIGEILVKAQLITEEQLERVLKIQKSAPNKYLGEILVELQLLQKEDVLKVIATQTYETIYDLFWWEDGQFNFDLKLVESYKKIPFALSSEQVLLNILRMVDEWAEIEKRVFSPHIVFRKTFGAKDQHVDPMFSPGSLKEKLTSEQEIIYQLVDETRTVQEIIDRSLLGKFNASEILSNLIEMGLIEVVELRAPSLIKKVGLTKLREVLTYAYYGAFFFIVFLLFLYLKPSLLQHVLDLKIEPVDFQAPTHFVHKVQMDRIKNALELYYLENGKYPIRLDELVSARMLQKGDLFYRKGVSYQYEVKDGRYFLKH